MRQLPLLICQSIDLRDSPAPKACVRVTNPYCRSASARHLRRASVFSMRSVKRGHVTHEQSKAPLRARLNLETVWL